MKAVVIEMDNKDEVLRLISERSRWGVSTSPDMLIRKLRIDDKEVEKILRELRRDNYIRLDEYGWRMAS